MLAAIALALAVQTTTATPTPQPTASPPAVDAENEPRIRTAAQLIRDRQPQAALDVLTTAVASYDAAYAGEKRRIYCAMSGPQTLLYIAMAARDRVGAIAVGPGYCTALHLKGFALIDLGRAAEARPLYERALALAPMNAQYLTEMGQLYRIEKNWPKMLSLCKKAHGEAKLAIPGTEVEREGGALRCQGYALVEEKKWNEAEKAYREALKLDPDDKRAAGELRYIAEHRGR